MVSRREGLAHLDRLAIRGTIAQMPPRRHRGQVLRATLRELGEALAIVVGVLGIAGLAFVCWGVMQ